MIELGCGPEGITVPPATKREQIIADLIASVRAGDLLPGARIPSAAELMRRYDCSISPVRDAIRELKVRGLLTGAPGLAVYVVDSLPSWVVD